MPGTDVTGGPPGASGFARDHLYRRDPSNGLGQVVYARLLAYQPSTLSFIDVSLDASGNLNTAGGGTGGGGAVTVADGADVAQGTTSDAAWVSGSGTVISLLKKIASAGGSAVSVADGADVAQGSTTDLSSANTVVGILKAVKASLAGTLATSRTWTLASGTDSVNVGNFPAVQHVQVDSGLITADTELPAAASMADAEVNPTVPRVGSMGMLWNGATWDRAPGSAAAGAKVQSAQLPATLGQKVMAASLPVVVASDQSAIPTSGTDNLAQVGGTAIAAKAASTFGVAALPVWPNAVQRDTYLIPINAISTGALTAATRKDVLSMEQAAASAKTIRIRRIVLSLVCTVAGAAAGLIQVNLFKGTAASSAGTAAAGVAANGASLGLNASFAAKTLPTIVAATGPVPLFGTWLLAAAGLIAGSTIVYDWQENGETVPLTLRAGVLESFVVAVLAASTPTVTVHGFVIVTEE